MGIQIDQAFHWKGVAKGLSLSPKQRSERGGSQRHDAPADYILITQNTLFLTPGRSKSDHPRASVSLQYWTGISCYWAVRTTYWHPYVKLTNDSRGLFKDSHFLSIFSIPVWMHCNVALRTLELILVTVSLRGSGRTVEISSLRQSNHVDTNVHKYHSKTD